MVAPQIRPASWQTPPPPPAPSYEVERKWRGRRAIVEILAQRMVLNLNVDEAEWLGLDPPTQLA